MMINEFWFCKYLTPPPTHTHTPSQYYRLYYLIPVYEIIFISMLINHWRKVNLKKRPKKDKSDNEVNLQENAENNYKIIDIENQNNDNIKENEIVEEESFVLHNY